ncbi:LPXTG cell wall anchor domain-containing protein [Listeria welshimeri]|nr:LPXTG cell wall anchor domain-containing protein [Listeria welshimeri]
MKKKQHLQQLLLALIIIVGINFWIGTQGELHAKAAELAKPTPINQIFPDPRFAEVIQVRLEKPNVTDTVSQDELNALTNVDSTYGLIDGVGSIEGIQYLNGMTQLVIQGGTLSDLSPLTKVTTLTYLNISNTQISDLSPISTLTNLTRLTMSGNHISDLSPLSNLTNLKVVNMEMNQIKDMSPLSELTNLIGVSMYNNKISDLSPLSSLLNLTSLTMDENQINDVSALSDLTKLKTLSLGNNQIDDISALSGLTNLEWLFIYDNQISNLSPLSDANKLFWFLFNDNKISDISVLSDKEELTYTDMSNNQISDLSPLKSLQNIMDISLENQQIENSPMNYQTNLVLPNTVKDNTNTLVTPETISDNGNYTSPDLTWDLPNYKNQVSYTFNQEVTVGSATTLFSGIVSQSLKQAPVAYNVLFNVDGEETSETVEMDTLLTSPAAPTKEGYTFTGWYNAPTGGNKWNFATDKMPANDITLYAQFSVNQYMVLLDVEGKISSQKVAYQEFAQAPSNPTKEGYTFTGWYDAPTGGNKWNFASGKMPANDITLYAQFTKQISPDNDSGTPRQGDGSDTHSNSNQNGSSTTEQESKTNTNQNSKSTNEQGATSNLAPSVQKNEDSSNLTISSTEESKDTKKTNVDLPKTGDKTKASPIILGMLCLGLAAFLGFQRRRVK